jgi:hypothetical protein
MISTYLIRFYFIFLCLKNGRNFNVVIVSFLPSDHRNDPDLLVFAVSCLSFFDANGTQLFFVLRRKRDSIIFRFFRTFLHTNLWYRFVLWYTSTLSVHVHNFCNWSYIFHVQILGTCFTDRTVLQRFLHTLLLKFHRTFWTYAEVVLIYTMVTSYTFRYIHEILLENLVLKIWIAHFNELC